MISNPRFIVERKVESSSQQIIRAIFIFLTPPSTVNSQQSSVNSHQSTVISHQSTVNSQQSTVNKHGRCNRNRYKEGIKAGLGITRHLSKITLITFVVSTIVLTTNLFD